MESGINQELSDYRSKEFSNLNYGLIFNIPDSIDQSISGIMEMTFTSANGKHLILDFAPDQMHFDSVFLNGTKAMVGIENGHLFIDKRYIEKGPNRLYMQFTAGELSLNRQEDMLYTLFVPARAHTAFPCMDQPDIKATFDLDLRMPKHWTAVSSSDIEHVTTNEQVVELRFKTSPKLSTYLFSFVAGEFDMLRSGNINVWLRDKDADKWNSSSSAISKLHEQSMYFLDKYTGISMPFDKLDIALIPGFQYGGMEHVGAIQYRENLILFDDKASQAQEIRRAKLIAHETAHMWFGNWVTMRWFDDVWMKEVFANFMADKIVNPMYPQIDHDLQFLMAHYPSAYDVDRTSGANPIRQPLENLNNAGSMYGNIIYHKAPIVLRQLEAMVGDSVFQAAVKQYLATYGDSNANWTDLISILDEHSDIDLNAWNKDWILSPGRPSISYYLDQNNDTINAMIIKQQAEDGSDRLWTQTFTVDLVYPDHQDRYEVKMNAAEVAIDVKGKPKPIFVQLNSTATGYGLFEVDSNISSFYKKNDSLISRAETYIDIYENMLSGSFEPLKALDILAYGLHIEQDPLLLKRLVSSIENIFWYEFDSTQRANQIASISDYLWKQMELSSSDKLKTLFKLYSKLAFHPHGIKQLQEVWNGNNNRIAELLNENDRTALALQIALFLPEYANNYIQDLRESYDNEDRIARLDFIRDALSADPAVRRAKMRSLKKSSERTKEPWVNTCLHYLHHPIRQAESVEQLSLCLDMLEDIQATGDIFFPKSWLDNSIGQYNSPAAKTILLDYIDKHPRLDPMLMAKVMQSTYRLQR